ncbi:seipin-1 [Heracleum sosnowskyi]|uniref:Seipin-1 n=1 Tax=Heracleum sosnowskyi TaxID=360622 RepID=A0AAD8MH98_9APIA|nr:seipin-1 [Heracleum sosnowskyi]
MAKSSSSSDSNNEQETTLEKPPPQTSLTTLLKQESQLIYSLFSSLDILAGGILRKVAAGLLGAAYVCFVLFVVMIVAVILGVGLVGLWVEEPVCVREKVLFDYSQVNPSATLAVGDYKGGLNDMVMREVPVGQTYSVDLVLVMPESDYNLQVGMFQLVAEAVSTNGHLIDRSSQPCMLRFRSLPVRLVRTCLFSVPLIIGIRFETQKITIPILRHKEGYPRTEAIKITIIPRAGTLFLPQLYDAEIIMNSELPWKKELVHSWKWTLYVWTSVYMYIMLLIVLGCWFRPLIFPAITASYSREEEDRDTTTEVRRERPLLTKEGREVSETMRKWKESRNKRKEMLLHGVAPETEGSSASSISVLTTDGNSQVQGIDGH